MCCYCYHIWPTSYSLSFSFSILAFSLWSITDVLVSINGGSNQSATLASKGEPLYVLPWQTSDYMHGKHSLTVFVKVRLGEALYGKFFWFRRTLKETRQRFLRCFH